MNARHPFPRAGLLALILALLCATRPIWAQTAPLSQTAQLVSDNGQTLTVSYPKGWATEVVGINLYLASSAAALEKMKNDPLTVDDGVGVVVALPELLEQAGLASDTPPEAALNALQEVGSLEGDIQLLPDTPIPVAVSMMTATDASGETGFLAALGFPNGTVIVGVQPSEAVDATVLAILDSITLTGSATRTGDAEATVITVEHPSGDTDLSFVLPDEWNFEYNASDGVVYIGNSENAIEQASRSAPEFDPGDVAVSLGLPAVLELLGIQPNATPEATLQGFLEFVEAEGKVRADSSFSVPAAQTRSTGGSAGSNAEVYALQFTAGTLIIAVQPLGVVDAEVLELLHSIRFGEAAAADDRTEAETVRQWAAQVDGSSQYGEESWSFAQAAGAPDTETCGDIRTAWASESASTRAYLILEYDQPVIPTQINIYQTYNPGSIVGVGVRTTENPDQPITLPDSADPVGNTPCPGVFTVDVSGIDAPVDAVVIYIDQTQTLNWNEIDAVELVGTAVE